MVRTKQVPKRRRTTMYRDKITSTPFKETSQKALTNSDKIKPHKQDYTASNPRGPCSPTNLLINMVSFQKWVKRIFNEMFQDTTNYRITCGALGALQEATEAYGVEVFKDADVCRSLSNRVSVMQCDIRLSHRFRKRN